MKPPLLCSIDGAISIPDRDHVNPTNLTEQLSYFYLMMEGKSAFKMLHLSKQKRAVENVYHTCKFSNTCSSHSSMTSLTLNVTNMTSDLPNNMWGCLDTLLCPTQYFICKDITLTCNNSLYFVLGWSFGPNTSYPDSDFLCISSVSPGKF
jgi:hypothetical protein